MNRVKVIVVSRHAGLLRWLQTQHPELEIEHVYKHVYEADSLKDRIVVGSLPVHLLAQPALFGYVSLTGVPLNKKGADLTCEEMIRYQARLAWYETRQVQGPKEDAM